MKKIIWFDYLYLFALVLVLIFETGMADTITLRVRGDLEGGIFAPTVESLAPSEKLIVSKIDETAELSTWQFIGKSPNDSYIICVFDHHPSISSSCVFSGVLKSSSGVIDVNISEIKEKTVNLVVSDYKLIPFYSKKSDQLVVGKLRRIDDIGRVSRWLLLKKNGELMSFTTKVKNLQSGTYLFDLYEQDGMVAETDPDIGYAVMTAKIFISGEKMLTFHLNSQLDVKNE